MSEPTLVVTRWKRYDTLVRDRSRRREDRLVGPAHRRGPPDSPWTPRGAHLGRAGVGGRQDIEYVGRAAGAGVRDFAAAADSAARRGRRPALGRPRPDGRRSRRATRRRRGWLRGRPRWRARFGNRGTGVCGAMLGRAHRASLGMETEARSRGASVLGRVYAPRRAASSVLRTPPSSTVPEHPMDVAGRRSSD